MKRNSRPWQKILLRTFTIYAGMKMSHMLPQIGTKCFFSAEEKTEVF